MSCASLYIVVLSVAVFQPTAVSGFGNPASNITLWNTLRHVSAIMHGNYTKRTDGADYSLLADAEGPDPEKAAFRPLFWMPTFGTLLGLARDGAPVDGDDDIDIHAFENDRVEITRRFTACGYNMQYNFGTFLRFDVYTAEKNANQIDRHRTPIDIWLIRPAYSTILEGAVYCHKLWDSAGARYGFYFLQSDVTTKMMHLAEYQEFSAFDQTIAVRMPLNPPNLIVPVYGEGWTSPNGDKAKFFSGVDFYKNCGNAYFNINDKKRIVIRNKTQVTEAIHTRLAIQGMDNSATIVPILQTTSVLSVFVLVMMLIRVCQQDATVEAV